MNDTNAKTNEKKNQSSFHNIGWKFFFLYNPTKFIKDNTQHIHTHTHKP